MSILHAVIGNLPFAAKHLAKKAILGGAEAAVVQCAAGIIEQFVAPKEAETLMKKQKDFLKTSGIYDEMNDKPSDFFVFKQKDIPEDVKNNPGGYFLKFIKIPDDDKSDGKGTKDTKSDK